MTEFDSLKIYTRSEVRENRLKWINFLLVKGRKKATGALDRGSGNRCCLGHGCFILGLKRKPMEGGLFEYEDNLEIAPVSFKEMVGLWDDTGSTDSGEVIWKFANENGLHHADLVGINDDTEATPREIGEYLLSVIEGGTNTPFIPLTDYPE